MSTVRDCLACWGWGALVLVELYILARLLYFAYVLYAGGF